MDYASYYTDAGVLVIGRTGTLPTPPSLVANVVLRLILCPIAVLLTWVPMRILWRNGEFPACTFVVNLWALMLFVFVNAALWRDQDFDGWWLGWGWCDLQAYIQYALVTLYSSSVCAIMQRLSSQVGLTRVTGLSAREKRQRLLVQSLIIFPVPVLQVAMTVFVQGQRYAIAPASGCTNEYDPTAVFLVFFVLPPLLFTIAACFHTFQTYRRFREVDSSSQAALGGINSVAFARRQRARRKLYFMVLCILVPYTPIMVAFVAVNLIEGWPWTYSSSFSSVHVHGPVPFNSISLLAAADLGFLALNMSWIPVVSAYVAFVFFGTSKEAINIYREYAVACGLAYFVPRLHDVYDPDRTPFDSMASGASNNTNTGTQFSTLDSISHSRKGSCAPICPPVSADVNVRPSFVTDLGRLFRRGTRNAPQNTDLELATSIAPVAPPFNPAFSWATAGPSTAPPQTSTSTASTAPMLVPMLSSNRAARPFDGTRANSIGGRAVSTHVWSEAGPLGSDAAVTRPADVHANTSESSLGDDLQQGVRVERSITTSQTKR